MRGTVPPAVLYTARDRANVEIAGSMNTYADHLLEVQPETGILRSEWLDVFFGMGEGTTARAEFRSNLERIMRVRHQLGEPYMYFDDTGFSEPMGVIGRPDGYRQHIPDSFFTYTIAKELDCWIGDVACSAFKAARRGANPPVLPEMLTLLSVERPFGQTVPDSVDCALFSNEGSDDDEPADLGSGIVIGLEAIGMLAESARSGSRPRRDAEKQMRLIYAAAGESVRTPRILGAD